MCGLSLWQIRTTGHSIMDNLHNIHGSTLQKKKTASPELTRPFLPRCFPKSASSQRRQLFPARPAGGSFSETQPSAQHLICTSKPFERAVLPRLVPPRDKWKGLCVLVNALHSLCFAVLSVTSDGEG